ncbi:MAG: bacterial Ig-like domain-containing protein, partial [Acholeplasmatales bacterium]|nr:bacterial Ig-like domain-containing protein [Acholeplasmatales bacterium]
MKKIGLLLSVFIFCFMIFSGCKKTTYILSFETNGGESHAQVTASKDTNIASLINFVPSRDGYTFNSWHTTSTLNAPLSEDMKLTKDTVLFASWNINIYNITYNYDSTYVLGNSNTKTTINVTEIYELLPLIITSGHYFEGWYTSSAKDTKITVLSNIKNNVTLYANILKGDSPVPPSVIIEISDNPNGIWNSHNFKIGHTVQFYAVIFPLDLNLDVLWSLGGTTNNVISTDGKVTFNEVGNLRIIASIEELGVSTYLDVVVIDGIIVNFYYDDTDHYVYASENGEVGIPLNIENETRLIVGWYLDPLYNIPYTGEFKNITDSFTVFPKFITRKYLDLHFNPNDIPSWVTYTGNLRISTFGGSDNVITLEELAIQNKIYSYLLDVTNVDGFTFNFIESISYGNDTEKYSNYISVSGLDLNLSHNYSYTGVWDTVDNNMFIVNHNAVNPNLSFSVNFIYDATDHIQTVLYGNNAIVPILQSETVNFEGWFLDSLFVTPFGGSFDFVTEDITVYASCKTRTYSTINFDGSVFSSWDSYIWNLEVVLYYGSSDPVSITLCEGEILSQNYTAVLETTYISGITLNFTQSISFVDTVKYSSFISVNSLYQGASYNINIDYSYNENGFTSGWKNNEWHPTLNFEGLEVIDHLRIILPSKTDYLIGESLDLSGFVLYLVYNSGKEELVDNGYQVSGFSSSEVGTVVISIEYLGLSTNFSVTIYETILESYFIFDSSQLQVGFIVTEVQVHYWGSLITDGNSLENVNDHYLVLNLVPESTVYKSLIKKEHVSLIEGFELKLKENEVYKTSNWISSTISEGEDVTINYVNTWIDSKFSITLDLNNNKTLLFNASALEGWNAYFLRVVLNFESKPSVTYFWQGFSTSDPDNGIDTTKTYSLTIVSELMVISANIWFCQYDTTDVHKGSVNIPINLFGQVAIDNSNWKDNTWGVLYIEGTAREIIDIRIEEPNKLYYFVGETENLEGLKVFVIYDNLTEELLETGYSVNGFNSLSSGSVTVTVSYEGFSRTYVVNIALIPEAQVESIYVFTNPTKTTYYKGETVLSLAGIVIKAVYDDESQTIVSYTSYSGFVSNTLGSVTITVFYNEFSTTFEINIVQMSVNFVYDSLDHFINLDYNTSVSLIPAFGSGVHLIGWYTDALLTVLYTGTFENITSNLVVYASKVSLVKIS